MPATDEIDRLARWKANLANGSQVYADVSHRRLQAFCKAAKSTPASVAEMEVGDLRRLLEDYLAREKKQGHSGGYIATTLKAVRSWRLYNGKSVVEGLKIPNLTFSPRVDQETMPTPEDLRTVLLAAKPNERVAISLMAFSGVRPQVIGSFDGSDGLTIGDLPEVKVSDGTVNFDKIPTIIRVRAKNSKTRNAYLTFLGDEGCLSVKQYLEERIIGGESIDAKSDLVHPDRAHKRFVSTTNLGDMIRRAMRAAGLPQRPYVWRSYFLSRLLEAQNAGKITDRYAEFFAGHRGDVTARHYTTGRANLASSLIEDMRRAYRRCEAYLSANARNDRTDEAVTRALRLLLTARGVPPEKVDQLDLAGKSDRELEDILRKIGASVGPERRTEKAVPVDDVQELLDDGWEFVSPLNGTMAVVRAPAALNDGVYPPARRAE